MPTPALSVVIPSVNGFADLTDCLAALERQTDASVELLVIDRMGESVRQRVRETHPTARLIAVEPGTTIPEMRARGFELASAAAVAVIADHVIAPPQWARQLLA